MGEVSAAAAAAAVGPDDEQQQQQQQGGSAAASGGSAEGPADEEEEEAESDDECLLLSSSMVRASQTSARLAAAEQGRRRLLGLRDRLWRVGRVLAAADGRLLHRGSASQQGALERLVRRPREIGAKVVLEKVRTIHAVFGRRASLIKSSLVLVLFHGRRSELRMGLFLANRQSIDCTTGPAGFIALHSPLRYPPRGVQVAASSWIRVCGEGRSSGV